MNEFEFYHGAAIARLLHGVGDPVEISTYMSASNASYVINGKTGVYIKYSKKRMSPWRFTFKKEHQAEIEDLKNKYGEVFLVLACHDDGIVALNYDELKIILNDFHDDHEWISLDRNRRQEYSVKGSDGKLTWKVAKNEFPDKIIKFLAVSN